MTIDEKIVEERRHAQHYVSYDNQKHKKYYDTINRRWPFAGFAFFAVSCLLLLTGVSGLIFEATRSKEPPAITTTFAGRQNKLPANNGPAQSGNVNPGNNDNDEGTQVTDNSDAVQPSSDPTKPPTSTSAPSTHIAVSSSGNTTAGVPISSGSGNGDDGSGSGSTGTATPPTNPPAITTAAVPKVTKILVIVEENHSLSQMRSGMPYLHSLMKKYSYANNYSAIRHPSLPNYVAMATGSTHGISNDKGPGTNAFNGTSAFAKALAAGKTAKLYAEGMQSNCATSNGGNKYVVRHNPWAYVKNERSLCRKYSVSMSGFNSDVRQAKLPNVGMVVPNLCHDAHDCSLGTADNWLKSQLKTVFAGPDWKAGRLAVVVTADEDDDHHGNNVLTAVIHPSQKGRVASCKLNHYSITRLFAEVSHTGKLGNARGANSITSCFRLPV